eukprot:Sdes_comp10321_c0_seq1m1962
MKVYKLSRTPAHRRALFRNLVTDLIRHERIETTTAKAKAIQRIAEKMITHGKKGQGSNEHQLSRFIFDRSLIPKIMGPLAERYRDRPGGYTRIVNLHRRFSDSARMSIIELIDNPFPPLIPKDFAQQASKFAPGSAKIITSPES